MSFVSDSDFENEVRRIARLLWVQAEFGGAEIVDERERDGIFEAAEFVHCIECTVSRQKQKAVEDSAKLDKLIRKLTAKHPTKFIRGWFITRDEPTADQRTVVHGYRGRIVACSYEHFRSKLVDAKSYLDQRMKYPFGSVRDPGTGSSNYELDYVALDMVLDGAVVSHSRLVDELRNNQRMVLTGDYGAGKSSTAREVFTSLAQEFWNGQVSVFPVFLNLRDHHGQTDPVEALERHARNIGFQSPASIVQAWRAGYCALILDGFDEIASAGWAGTARRLRELRYRSMELVRRFIRDNPGGMLLTGRGHFFDSDGELRQALALGGKGFLQLRLNELAEDQIVSLLGRVGWRGEVPEWLPARPLLLAYLAAQGLLSPNVIDSVASPAVGWNDLLDKIAERETEIEAGVEPATLRRLIEALASAARTTLDGLGPIQSDTIVETFKIVCGQLPDDHSAVLLQRLPGLAPASSEDGSRIFVDRDFVEAARSGDVFHYIENPHGGELAAEHWQSAMRSLGTKITAHRCNIAGYSEGKIGAAISAAASTGRIDILVTDLVSVMCQVGGRYIGGNVFIKEVVVEEIEFEDAIGDVSRVEFQDCIIGRLEIAADVHATLPRFLRCHFGEIIGRAGPSDLSQDKFVECTCDGFEHAANTTSAILELALPLSTKVMLTILKKLYAQSGRGRKEAALYRGLDQRAQQLVPEILSLLRGYGFAIRTRQGNDTVWLPGRTGGQRHRALTMLASPSVSSDPLLEASRLIGD